MLSDLLAALISYRVAKNLDVVKDSPSGGEAAE